MSLLPNGFPLSRFELSNGLKLFVIENHSAPVLTYETWFNVGSQHEKQDPALGVTGLAHLFEHMMFRGTRQYPDGRFDEILARNGADDENATTWLDRTNYYQSVPSDKLELIVSLESDRMTNLALDQKLLETEKGAVLGELRMGLDDPDTISYDTLYDTAFIHHPYRHTTIGTEAEIKSFTVEQANYFYRKYYAPNNATLLIVGDVEPLAALELVEKYYGAIKAHALHELKAAPEPEQTSAREREFVHPQLSQTRVIFAYPVVGVTHPDFAALWVLMSVLTYGQGALLEEAWVNQGIAISAYGDLNQFRDPGLFILMADLLAEKDEEQALNSAEKALNEVFVHLSGKITPNELTRAKSQLLLLMYQQCEDNASLASFMGEFISSAGDPLFSFELLSRVEKVQAKDLARIIPIYFKKQRQTRIVGRPSVEEDS
jgi:zinc protease